MAWNLFGHKDKIPVVDDGLRKKLQGNLQPFRATYWHKGWYPKFRHDDAANIRAHPSLAHNILIYESKPKVLPFKPASVKLPFPVHRPPPECGPSDPVVAYIYRWVFDKSALDLVELANQIENFYGTRVTHLVFIIGYHAHLDQDVCSSDNMTATKIALGDKKDPVKTVKDPGLLLARVKHLVAWELPQKHGKYAQGLRDALQNSFKNRGCKLGPFDWETKKEAAEKEAKKKYEEAKKVYDYELAEWQYNGSGKPPLEPSLAKVSEPSGTRVNERDGGKLGQNKKDEQVLMTHKAKVDNAHKDYHCLVHCVEHCSSQTENVVVRFTAVLAIQQNLTYRQMKGILAADPTMSNHGFARASFLSVKDDLQDTEKKCREILCWLKSNSRLKNMRYAYVFVPEYPAFDCETHEKEKKKKADDKKKADEEATRKRIKTLEEEETRFIEEMRRRRRLPRARRRRRFVARGQIVNSVGPYPYFQTFSARVGGR